MTAPLVLSLFPGIGLLDMAFEEQGFCVVRGPDLLWGGDVRRFHPPAGRFDGVIGGPPCQAFSRLQKLVEWNRNKARAAGDMESFAKAENMIPEFERVVREAAPQWYLMENVPDAPMPETPSYARQPVILCDHWTGGETARKRRFTFGHVAPGRALQFRPETLALHTPNPEPAVLAHGGAREVPVAVGGSGKTKQTIKAKKGAAALGYQSAAYFAVACRRQGLPAEFDLPPFTVNAKIRAVGNGVPLAMGRAVARAVAEAIGMDIRDVPLETIKRELADEGIDTAPFVAEIHARLAALSPAPAPSAKETRT